MSNSFPDPPGPPGQSSGSYEPTQKASNPYDSGGQPSNPYGVGQPPGPYGVGQPSSPYGVGQPPSPYGPVGQPPSPYDSGGQPSGPYGPVAQPPSPYGVGQPPSPYGPAGQPVGQYGPAGQPMPQPGNQTHDPVVQFLQLALTGFGYNFYNTKNQARSDDLLVRAKASGFLTDAASYLTTLAEEYHRRYIPPLTREHPDPPREAMAVLDDLRRLLEEIGTLETHVRAMAVPTADRIWERFRAELPTLRQLMQFDLDLVRGAQNFFQQASSASGDTWTLAQAHELRSMLRWLNQVAQAREQFLRMPT